MAFTFFFRDAEVLDMAIRHALPSMSGQAFIHIWEAGCAHGAETYTLAMLLRERMSEFVFRNVRIHASDVEAGFERGVRDGVFPEEQLKRIPQDLLRHYFLPAETAGTRQVVADLRARVTFQHHDLLSLKPVREGLAMVVCKNVLLHFEPHQRCDVLRMFHGALRADGLLVMEHTQKLPEELRPLFTPVFPNAQIHRKIDVPVVPRTSRLDGLGSGVDATPSRPPHIHVTCSKSSVSNTEGEKACCLK